MWTLFLLLVFPLTDCVQNWYKDCGDEAAAVEFKELNIVPDVASFGGNITIQGTLSVNEDIGNKTISKLDFWRRFTLVGYDLHIGCFAGYGSCKKPLCAAMKDATLLCNYYQTVVGTNCGCHRPVLFKPGEYVGAKISTVFPTTYGIAQALLSGLYRVRWQWVQDHRILACIVGEINISD